MCVPSPIRWQWVTRTGHSTQGPAPSIAPGKVTSTLQFSTAGKTILQEEIQLPPDFDHCRHKYGLPGGASDKDDASGRRQWQPTPVLLPGKSRGWRRLISCSPWGREESDTTERLHFSLSCTGDGNGNPLQYSCLENLMDRGACWATVHRVTKSWTWLKQVSMHARRRKYITGWQWSSNGFAYESPKEVWKNYVPTLNILSCYLKFSS